MPNVGLPRRSIRTAVVLPTHEAIAPRRATTRSGSDEPRVAVLAAHIPNDASRADAATSPGSGTLKMIKDIGDPVQEGEIIGHVGDKKLVSPISGFVWGIIRTPAEVKEGQKLGDILPGNDKSLCFEITPQAKLIAEGVIKTILKYNPEST